MAGTIYNGLNVQCTDQPTCGVATLEDLSVWPTPILWDNYPFARADVKLVVFWIDDVGVSHWDITNTSPWTLTGYTTDGYKIANVFVIPIWHAGLGSSPSDNNGLHPGMVIFDPTDSNYYLITAYVVGPCTAPSLNPGSVLLIDDGVMSIDIIWSYFRDAYDGAATKINEWHREYYLYGFTNPAWVIYCFGKEFTPNVSLTNNCTEIQITDNTEVSFVPKNEWQFQWMNIGRAIFVENIDGTFIFGGYFAPGVPVFTNNIPIPSNGTYRVHIFYEEQYNAMFVPYAENDVVYDNGAFYIIDALGALVTISANAAGLATCIANYNTGGGWHAYYTDIVTINCGSDNPTFETEISDDCLVIRVEDQTSWPVMQGVWDREDSAIAIFYSYAGTWYADFNNFGDNTTLGEWTLPVLGNGLYTIVAFVNPVWRVGNSWNANCIVYDNGNWYQATTIHIPGELAPSTGAAGWQILSSLDYTIFAANWNSGSIDYYYGIYQTQVFVNCFTDDGCPECPEVIQTSPVIPSSCHGFTVLNPFDATVRNVVVKIWSLDMQELLGCGIIDVIAGENVYNFSTDVDGIYIVQIGYQTELGVCEIDYEEEYREYPAIDFCNAQTCFTQLTQILLCNELDPCCRNCDPEFIQQRLIYREELNKMIALMFQLYAYINVDQVNYLSSYLIYQYDFSANIYYPVMPDRNLILQRINDLIEKLADITGRCGDCNGPRVDLSTTPCTDCGGKV